MSEECEEEQLCGICGGTHDINLCTLLQIKNHVPDTVVLSKARLSLPVSLALQFYSDGTHSVETKEFIGKGTKFGPFEAKRVFSVVSNIELPLKVFSSDEYFKEYFLDNSSEFVCNWMYFVRAAVCLEEQNLICLQDKSELYYVSIRDIVKGEKLLVWYGAHYVKLMGKALLTSRIKQDIFDFNTTENTMNIDELVKTQDSVKERDNWLCKFCGRQETDVSKFAKHIIVHYQMKMKRACELCNEVFHNKLVLNKHIRVKHTENQNTLTACVKVNVKPKPPAVVEKPVISTGDDDESSSLGGPLLANNNLTDTGQSSSLETGDLDFNNTASSTSFGDSTSLLTDESGLPVFDEDMEVEFTNQFNFNVNDDRIVCDICTKTFKTLKLLLLHLVYHTGKFNCTICRRVFARKENLLSHGCCQPQKFNCDFTSCKSIFTSQKNLNRHKKTCHNTVTTSNTISLITTAPLTNTTATKPIISVLSTTTISPTSTITTTCTQPPPLIPVDKMIISSAESKKILPLQKIGRATMLSPQKVIVENKQKLETKSLLATLPELVCVKKTAGIKSTVSQLDDNATTDKMVLNTTANLNFNTGNLNLTTGTLNVNSDNLGMDVNNVSLELNRTHLDINPTNLNLNSGRTLVLNTGNLDLNTGILNVPESLVPNPMPIIVNTHPVTEISTNTINVTTNSLNQSTDSSCLSPDLKSQSILLLTPSKSISALNPTSSTPIVSKPPAKKQTLASRTLGDVTTTISQPQMSISSSSEFPCPECQKIFQSKNGLRRHEARHRAATAAGKTLMVTAGTGGRRSTNVNTNSRTIKPIISKAAITTNTSLITGGSTSSSSLSASSINTAIASISSSNMNDSGIMTSDSSTCTTVNNASVTSNTATREVELNGASSSTVYLCPVCNKKFRSTRYLREHERTHQPPPYVCKYCDQGFTKPLALQKHVTLHLNLKQETCDKCQKSFDTTHDHICTHSVVTNTTPAVAVATVVATVAVVADPPVIPCPEPTCNSTFTTEDKLRRHHDSVHRRACALCKLVLPSTVKLRAHEALCKPTDYYVCPLCLGTFKLRSSLVRHVRQKHDGADVELPPKKLVKKVEEVEGVYERYKEDEKTVGTRKRPNKKRKLFNSPQPILASPSSHPSGEITNLISLKDPDEDDPSNHSILDDFESNLDYIVNSYDASMCGGGDGDTRLLSDTPMVSNYTSLTTCSSVSNSGTGGASGSDSTSCSTIASQGAVAMDTSVMETAPGKNGDVTRAVAVATSNGAGRQMKDGSVVLDFASLEMDFQIQTDNCLSMPELNDIGADMSLGDNTYILDTGGIEPTMDDGKVLLYVLENEQPQL